jgi:pimeloyl-ACP methyl ester carboxylesterase
LFLHGYHIWNRGPLPLLQDENDEDAEYCVSNGGGGGGDHGRSIEYFVWGSERPDATVVVYCHGSNSTGKHLNQFMFPHDVLLELNVKAISPSYPGHGGSDVDPNRRISKWPITDLEPILYDEGVNDFVVIGTSYGTAHAMATAACFPKRCVGMGLHVPYLPENVCREFGFHTDADYVLTESQLKRPRIHLPLLSILSLIQTFVGGAFSLYPEGRQAKSQHLEILDVLAKDATRSFWRGVNGQLYEMLNADTNQHWQDPRTIETKNVVIWYALDDHVCPPAHGKWLTDVFTKKKQDDGATIKCHVRAEERGLGHVTYIGEDDRNTAGMTKVLLEMIQNDKNNSTNNSSKSSSNSNSSNSTSRTLLEPAVMVVPMLHPVL